jgi:hypothetical protein
MMPDMNRVESLLKLADFSWRDYSERRSIEWKINFALWLALGSFGGFMFQHQTPLRLWVRLAITALLSFSFLVYTFLWKAEVKDRNLFDKGLVQYYWCEVNKELSMKPSSSVRPATHFKGWPKTHLSQVAITLLFELLAALSVWLPLPATNAN